MSESPANDLPRSAGWCWLLRSALLFFAHVMMVVLWFVWGEIGYALRDGRSVVTENIERHMVGGVVMGIPIAVVTSPTVAAAFLGVPMIKGVLVIVGAGWITAAAAGFATGWIEGWTIAVNAIALGLYFAFSVPYALRLSKSKSTGKPAPFPSVE